MATLYAIGLPGCAIRTFFGSTDPRDIPKVMLPGETAIPVDHHVTGRIAADGGSIELIATSLDELRAALWKRAKDVRFAHESAGADVPGLWRVQTGTVPPFDGESRIAIEAARAARALAAGSPWSKDFKFADNIVRTVDARQMLAIDDAVSAHIQACRDAAEAIRARIFDDAIDDEAALDAIDLTEGYPAFPTEG